MAKKKKTNKLGHEHIGVVGGRSIFRDNEGKFTDEEGKLIEETLPGYAKFLSSIFPDTYSSDKQRTVFKEQQEKAASEEKRNKEESALQLQTVEDYIRENNSLLREQLAEMEQSSTLLSEIAEKIGDISKNGSSVLDVIKGLTNKIPSVRGGAPKGGGPTGTPKVGPTGPKVPLAQSKPSILSRTVRGAGRVLPVLGAGFEAKNVYDETGNLAKAGAAGAGTLAGTLAGAQLGATAGAIGGPIGAGIGGIVGGIGGAVAGSGLGQKAYDYFAGPSQPDKKKTQAIAEAEKRGKNDSTITFKAEEIRFNADKLKFEVETLTIKSKNNTSSISSSSGGVGGGGGGPSAAPSNSTPQGPFNSSVQTPAFSTGGVGAGKGAYTGFTGASPTTESVKDNVAKAMSFSPASGFAGSSSGDLKGVIDAAAAKAGIDPRIMYGIVAGESLHKGEYDIGDGGLSFGPFQLYTGGGLGNEFLKQTGLNLSNPATIPQQAAWVANYIKQHPGMNIKQTWHGYNGNADWNPKWGDAGYKAPITDVKTVKTSAPAGLLGAGLAKDAYVFENKDTKELSSLGENLATHLGVKPKSTEETKKEQQQTQNPIAPLANAIVDAAASREINNKFDWSFGEAPPSDVPLTPMNQVLGQLANQTSALASNTGASLLHAANRYQARKPPSSYEEDGEINVEDYLPAFGYEGEQGKIFQDAITGKDKPFSTDPITGLKQGPGQVTPAAQLYPISRNVQTFGDVSAGAFNNTSFSTDRRPPPLVSNKVDKHVDSKIAKPKQPGVINGGNDNMIRRVFEILGPVALGYAAYQGLHHNIGRGRR